VGDTGAGPHGISGGEYASWLVSGKRKYRDFERALKVSAATELTYF
jgi:hypothetical protein